MLQFLGGSIPNHPNNIGLYRNLSVAVYGTVSVNDIGLVVEETELYATFTVELAIVITANFDIATELCDPEISCHILGVN